MGFVAYNLLMALQVVAALLIVRHSRQPAPVRTTVGFVMAALGTGAVMGFGLYPTTDADNVFATMNMWAYGLFAHLPVLLGGQAWLLLGRKRVAAIVFAALAVANAAVTVDMFFFEPYDLQVRRVTVRSAKLDRSYRVAVIADIQTNAPGPYEHQMFLTAVAERPDLILMPGDFIQGDTLEQHRRAERALHAMIKRIALDAPLGVHAVQGNIDADQTWTSIFTETAVTPYVTTTSVSVGGLRITALSFDASFRPDLEIAADPRFHIVFGHSPDFALGRVQADLLVAGHTHGGQVQLPGIGPLITFSQVPRAWADGTTQLSEGRTLVVSRGIGMERKYAPRMRFFCRPEIVIIDLEPALESERHRRRSITPGRTLRGGAAGEGRARRGVGEKIPSGRLRIGLAENRAGETPRRP